LFLKLGIDQTTSLSRTRSNILSEKFPSSKRRVGRWIGGFFIHKDERMCCD
jgi:hypothetical protein